MRTCFQAIHKVSSSARAQCAGSSSTVPQYFLGFADCLTLLLELLRLSPDGPTEGDTESPAPR